MSIISEEQEAQFNTMRDLIKQCLEVTELLNFDEETSILNERLSRLKSAALFVIVGEVKAGKSSFVNALLKSDICEVAPDPCTSKIQEIVYGSENDTIHINHNCERIMINNDVLKEVTIVDTPGTNSIIKDHQTITENFIPQSDLIIFVFSSTNPHTGSAWDFLKLIQKEWRRKAIFILQQSDRASSDELRINEDRVKQYARERNIQNPLVFSVSAKNEIEGRPNSGFDNFREYIQKSIANGDIWQSKVESIKGICTSVTNSIEKTLSEEKKILQDDLRFYKDLKLKLDTRREKIRSFQDIAVNSLSAVYDRQLNKLEKEFQKGLRIGSVLKRSVPFLRDKDIETWINDLQTEFRETASKEIEDESYKVSKNISSELKLLFEDLNENIEKRYRIIDSSNLNLNTDRDEILKNLEVQLEKFKNSKILEDKASQVGDIGNFTLAGGGLTALGAIIATVTNIMIFDITGGVLAAIGGALIGVTLLWKRSGIIKEFSENIEDAKVEFRERISMELENMFNNIFYELEYLINNPQADTENRLNELTELLKRTNNIKVESQKLNTINKIPNA